MSVVFCAWLCVGVCTRVCVQYCVSVAKVYVCVLRVGVGACGSVCETWDKVSIAIKVSLYVCGDSECMSEVISGRGSRFSHTHTHTHTHGEVRRCSVCSLLETRTLCANSSSRKRCSGILVCTGNSGVGGSRPVIVVKSQPDLKVSFNRPRPG